MILNRNGEERHHRNQNIYTRQMETYTTAHRPIETTELCLTLVEQIFSILPRYSSRKMDAYYDLKTQYLDEKIKPFGKRNDVLLAEYRRRLLEWVRDFGAVLEKGKDEL